MTKMIEWRIAAAAFALWIATTALASAQTFTLLASFNVINGEEPEYVSLVQGHDGSFYGTTAAGGKYAEGSIFKITTDGQITTLYSFCAVMPCPDGRIPYAGLLQGTDGNFYGTTLLGGQGAQCIDSCGTLFKITPSGVLTTLYSFCTQPGCPDGSTPSGTLIQGIDGYLYGTTEFGGGSNYSFGGTVFRIDNAGNLTTLHSFCIQPNCPDGSFVYAGVILAGDGNFYGTTSAGGIGCQGGGGCGTVFRLTPAGDFTTLYEFNGTDGANPQSALVEAKDGRLYGATATGGTRSGSTVFSITRAGTLRTLYNFCEADSPCLDVGGTVVLSPLIQATDGNLYGTTTEGGNPQCNDFSGCGTIFRISAAGGLTFLHFFDGTDGESITDGLFQSTNGMLYGITRLGGHYGAGTVFSIDMGLGPFIAFDQAFGKVGQRGGILGQGLTGTTAVSMNGIPANFTVVSDTFIRATVPQGATTGFVTVTTPSGVLTSNVPFHVIP